MLILVACEESQAVTIELRRLGHEAFSCDLEPCSGGHPEWHINSDVRYLLNKERIEVLTKNFKTQDGEWHTLWHMWDMIIAFPPCTYISNAGAAHLYKGHKLNEERYQKGLKGKEFFMMFYNCDCEKIAIENPVSSKIFNIPQHTQEIQPWQFGHPVQKKTRLWLKGLPLLEATQIIEPTQSCHDAHTWFSKGGKDRQKNRAKTFPGIAKAMAEQWTQ
jgi:hypothetical protein